VRVVLPIYNSRLINKVRKAKVVLHFMTLFYFGKKKVIYFLQCSYNFFYKQQLYISHRNFGILNKFSKCTPVVITNFHFSVKKEKPLYSFCCCLWTYTTLTSLPRISSNLPSPVHPFPDLSRIPPPLLQKYVQCFIILPRHRYRIFFSLLFLSIPFPAFHF